MFKKIIRLFKIWFCNHFYIYHHHKKDIDFLDIWVECHKCWIKHFLTFPEKIPKKEYKQVFTTPPEIK